MTLSDLESHFSYYKLFYIEYLAQLNTHLDAITDKQIIMYVLSFCVILK